MRTSIIAASVAFLSLVQAVPQFSAASSLQSTATSASTVATQAAASTSSTACNNSPLLCGRSYSNITHMGAHDVAFLRDSSTSFSTAGNQFYNATTALSAGLRLLQAQVHNQNGTLELCHTSCNLLDGGTLEQWLADIKAWMDRNLSEVVTILLVNSDNEPVANFASVFETSGIDTYGFTPSTSTGPLATWPTLQTMITANTRLVTFIASITYSTTYPYLLPEFNFVFETAFGVTSADGFNCTLDRPTTLSSASTAITAGYLSLINHFADKDAGFGITIPAITNITNTNSASTDITGALGTQASQCETEWGRKPVFMLVDFWNVGPSIQTADNLNGITATGRKSVSQALLSADTSFGTRTDGTSASRLAAVVLGAIAVGNFVWL